MNILYVKYNNVTAAKKVNTFKKIGHSRPFFVYFRLFKRTLQILQQINVKKIDPVYGSGIRTHDLWNTSLLP